jgi:hypothetical protein
MAGINPVFIGNTFGEICVERNGLRGIYLLPGTVTGHVGSYNSTTVIDSSRECEIISTRLFILTLDLSYACVFR